MKKILWAMALLTLVGTAIAGDEEKGHKKGFMGVSLTIVDNNGANQDLFVESVHDESGAERAGVLANDKILTINGVEIPSYEQLEKALAEAGVGEAIDLQVLRDGKTIDLNLVLGERPERNVHFGKRWGVNLNEYRAFMGIDMQNLNDQMASYFGVTNGVLITEVKEGGPAGNAGLRAGDIILAWDGEDIQNPNSIRKHLSQLKAGDEVSLTIQRKDDRLKMPLTLGSRKGFADESLQQIFMDMENIRIDIPAIKLDALKSLESLGDLKNLEGFEKLKELENFSMDTEAFEQLKEQLKEMKLDSKIQIDYMSDTDNKDKEIKKKKDKGQLH